MEIIELLIKCPLFRGVSKEELENLLKIYGYSLQKFPSENIVALLGEKCEHLIIILEGGVRGEMIDESGKLIKIEEIKAPSPIAHAFLFAEQNIFPVTITTLENSRLVFIEKHVFIELLQKNKNILVNYLTLISNRSKFLSEKISFLAFKTIKNKLAAFILKRAQEQQKTYILLTETQQELADYFGVTRPSLARSLNLLEEEGLICIEKKKITIKNMSTLKELAR